MRPQDSPSCRFVASIFGSSTEASPLSPSVLPQIPEEIPRSVVQRFSIVDQPMEQNTKERASRFSVVAQGPSAGDNVQHAITAFSPSPSTIARTPVAQPSPHLCQCTKRYNFASYPSTSSIAQTSVGHPRSARVNVPHPTTASCASPSAIAQTPVAQFFHADANVHPAAAASTLSPCSIARTPVAQPPPARAIVQNATTASYPSANTFAQTSVAQPPSANVNVQNATAASYPSPSTIRQASVVPSSPACDNVQNGITSLRPSPITTARTPRDILISNSNSQVVKARTQGVHLTRRLLSLSPRAVQRAPQGTGCIRVQPEMAETTGLKQTPQTSPDRLDRAFPMTPAKVRESPQMASARRLRSPQAQALGFSQAASARLLVPALLQMLACRAMEARRLMNALLIETPRITPVRLTEKSLLPSSNLIELARRSSLGLRETPRTVPTRTTETPREASAGQSELPNAICADKTEHAEEHLDPHVAAEKMPLALHVWKVETSRLFQSVEWHVPTLGFKAVEKPIPQMTLDLSNDAVHKSRNALSGSCADKRDISLGKPTFTGVSKKGASFVHPLVGICGKASFVAHDDTHKHNVDVRVLYDVPKIAHSAADVSVPKGASTTSDNALGSHSNNIPALTNGVTDVSLPEGASTISHNAQSGPSKSIFKCTNKDSEVSLTADTPRTISSIELMSKSQACRLATNIDSQSLASRSSVESFETIGSKNRVTRSPMVCLSEAAEGESCSVRSVTFRSEATKSKSKPAKILLECSASKTNYHTGSTNRTSSSHTYKTSDSSIRSSQSSVDRSSKTTDHNARAHKTPGHSSKIIDGRSHANRSLGNQSSHTADTNNNTGPPARGRASLKARYSAAWRASSTPHKVGTPIGQHITPTGSASPKKSPRKPPSARPSLEHTGALVTSKGSTTITARRRRASDSVSENVESTDVNAMRCAFIDAGLLREGDCTACLGNVASALIHLLQRAHVENEKYRKKFQVFANNIGVKATLKDKLPKRRVSNVIKSKTKEEHMTYTLTGLLEKLLRTQKELKMSTEARGASSSDASRKIKQLETENEELRLRVASPSVCPRCHFSEDVKDPGRLTDSTTAGRSMQGSAPKRLSAGATRRPVIRAEVCQKLAEDKITDTNVRSGVSTRHDCRFTTEERKARKQDTVVSINLSRQVDRMRSHVSRNAERIAMLRQELGQHWAVTGAL